jgi:hypothetical protein
MGKVLHASSSGYYPFCLSSSLNNSYFDGGLENNMTLFWRVKNWGLLFDVSWIVTSPVSTTTEISTNQLGSSGPFKPNGAQIGDEESLVCADYIFFEWPCTQIVTTPSSTTTTTVIARLTVGGQATESRIYFTFSVADILITSDPPPFLPRKKAGDANIVAYNINRAIPAYVITSFNIFSPTGFDDISLTATEYWSYGNTWDTTTGARP